MKFSLIMATLGRYTEPLSFLNSLTHQDYSNFEVIVVDQNGDNKLKDGIEDLGNINYPVRFLNVDPKGLSYARNKAIEIASGDILAFPDDDCEYLPNTLSSVYLHFKNDPSLDVVKGKIVDRKGNDSLKKWSALPFALKRYKVFFTASSVTMFIKNGSSLIKFDEQLGAGSIFGSCEDVDLIYRLLESDKKIWYFPNVQIYHPSENIQALDKRKIWNYGRGFGAYTRKHLTLSNFFIFSALFFYHMIKGIVAILMCNMQNAKKRWWYLNARIQGFIMYEDRN